MINSLKYDVTFPTTGRSFSGDVVFSEGLTAITGRNEAGKSLTLEFTRYLLFGSRALRGKADDYKTFKGELRFTLRGNVYRVARKGTKAELFCGDDQIATGTKPVNEHIIGLFGYGLEVFDVANNCAQGEIEALGSMKPSERKALVDRTIGLEAIDRVAATVAQRLADSRAAVAAVEETLTKPEKPAKPEGYVKSDKVRKTLNEARSADRILVEHQAWLDAREDLNEPRKPKDPHPEMSQEAMEENQRKLREMEDRISSLNEKLSQVREPVLTRDQIEDELDLIERHARWGADQALLRESPRPAYGADTLEEIEKAQKADEIRERIAHIEARDHVECPECGHGWNESDEELNDLRLQIPLYDDDKLPEGWETVNVGIERKRFGKYEAIKDQLTGEEPPGREPGYTRAQLEAELELHNSRSIIKTMVDERDQLEIELPKNLHVQLAAKRQFNQEVERYQREKITWDNYVKGRKEREAEIRKAEKTKGINEIPQLEAKLEEAIAYEANLMSYKDQKARYDEQIAKLKERKEELDQWQAARKTLRTLKASIKMHLLPSLNTVASYLISQMTGGDRNQIRIDEDFEISVDGQPLNTLSGSGKAVANLAIRLGLGQVLTNKTFSVFMADEIDASMDVDRSGFTAECLTNLTGSISQILLVSHKDLNAPNTIEIGASYGNSLEREGANRQRAA